MKLVATGILVALVLAAQACQSTPPAAVATPAAGKSAALRNMEPVAIAAHRCWFASGDPAFRNYSFANELDSHSGKPRFLIVPRSDYGGRPLLVVQAEGASGQVIAFGPLIDQPEGARVAADIRRWSSGEAGCAASA